ncbi:Uncharacterised protein [Mycobacteroides abscessus subsp. abscessus]|nr:hypothetical protein [Mycobacteroides abscessus]SHT79952.1 Uncharacterised protein [Mycobacteroides abscessus subsp. abscessus]PVA35241.1 hypothetical protein DDJ88_04620 [Mycobacteroides abscessus]PVA52986.1 hypothetical protein DDJ35_05320 [Mycobacteroides abscessus]QOF42720.1 hypothetical protein E3G69_001760 [Mycobacteroides abscessus]
MQGTLFLSNQGSESNAIMQLPCLLKVRMSFAVVSVSQGMYVFPSMTDLSSIPRHMQLRNFDGR